MSHAHTISLDEVEFSRKHFSLVSVGLSEQRIRFREVEIRRKSSNLTPPNDPQSRPAIAGPSISKWKESVDQMIGKETGPRKGKGQGSKKTKKGKGKEKATEEGPDGLATGSEGDCMVANPIEDNTLISFDDAMDLG